MFDVDELEMVINSINYVDVEDWMTHTEYKGAYYKEH
jgi:HECT-domain (ubiquitin-transferase)